jgi:mono/diheme cytochrome c family protein
MKNSLLFFLVIWLSACQSKEEITYKQYLANGRDLYETKCANCHQSSGLGLGKLYPNISNYRFLENKDTLTCIILKGKGAMPAQPQLQPLDLAMLTTYLQHNFLGQRIIVYPKEFAPKCP